VNFKNSRDLTIIQNFALFLSSNEKMVKIKVVELFKPYNFYLGFKFKNAKDRVLF
jgi:hypothetical protein